jgi:hypothetical protein
VTLRNFIEPSWRSIPVTRKALREILKAFSIASYGNAKTNEVGVDLTF